MKTTDKYNSEGYPDPTTYEALKNITTKKKKNVIMARVRPYMPKVFICSPYAGDIKRNTDKALEYCRFAVKRGYIPFAPHIFFTQFLDDRIPVQRELGIFMGTVYLDDCREIWVFGNDITCGMTTEIKRARCQGLKTRYFKDNCEEVRINV